VEPVQALTELGGIAQLRDLRALTTRTALGRALASGLIIRLPRTMVALPGADSARSAAAATGGVVSHLSAAQHWQWKVKLPPPRPSVTVPRGRRLDRDGGRLLAQVDVHWSDLLPDEVVDGITCPARTVVDCARDLPFAAALAVADSALRSGLVTPTELLAAAARSPRTGRSRALRVAREATALADNPFESALRAIVLEFPLLRVRPQAEVVARGMVFHPDLVDERLGIVIEADSFEFHTSQEAHARDCVRYTALTVEGWLVLRFTWHQVMESPSYVRAVLTDLVARTDRRAKPA